MTLDELLARFEQEYLMVHNISAARRREQVSLLRKLDASMDKTPLVKMEPRHVLAYIGVEIQRGVHPRTGGNHLSMVRSFAEWLHGAGLIGRPALLELRAMSRPRGSSGAPMPMPYTAEEIREFRRLVARRLPPPPTRGKGSMQLAAFTRRRRNGESPLLHGLTRNYARRLQVEAQVALALEAGLRRSEIHNLSLMAMHFENDELIVMTAKQGPGDRVRRSIPYTGHARACVKQWLDFRFLLAPDHGSPWLQLFCDVGTPQSLESQLRPETLPRLSKKLQNMFGQKWRWHRFRHTAATEWLRSGVPIEKVQKFMGHSSIAMTLRYTEILNRDISDAFAAAEADFAQRLGLDDELAA